MLLAHETCGDLQKNPRILLAEMPDSVGTTRLEIRTEAGDEVLA